MKGTRDFKKVKEQFREARRFTHTHRSQQSSDSLLQAWHSPKIVCCGIKKKVIHSSAKAI